MTGLRRVVVTGVGMVSPLGAGVDNVWKRLLNAESGIGTIQGFDASHLPSTIGGEVPIVGGVRSDDPFALDPEAVMPDKERRRVDPITIYALAAATEAVEMSGWKPTDEEGQDRTGVMIGSGIGGIQSFTDAVQTVMTKGARRLSPFAIPAILVNLPSGHISMKYGFRGPNHANSTACTTGTHAIGDSARMIALGDADVMVAGGTEHGIIEIGVAGFCAARALSTKYNDSPTQASRPWDKGRDGFVMGSGSGVVVLEELEHAKARGANIIAEVRGYGMSGDAHHITAPPEDGNGGRRAMQNALRSGGMNVEDIDYVNAHGTSTPLGDLAEFRAVRELFGEHRKSMSMSSTKSAVGHALGAAGALEAIFCLMAIRDQVAPPTLNLTDPEDDIDMDLVPNHPRERQIRATVSNSFGFGGTNGSVIFSSFDG